MITKTTNIVRSGMTILARGLNKATRGHLHPNAVTIFAVLIHLPIAYLIADGQHRLAGFLLILSVLDALDGALARVQGRSSNSGALLDAATDRLKEAMIFGAIAYWFTLQGNELGMAAAFAAFSASVLVSYIKAKGESMVGLSKPDLSQAELNKLFASGLMKYEVRTVLVILGLMSERWLQEVVLGIAIFASITAGERLIKTMRALS